MGVCLRNIIILSHRKSELGFACACLCICGLSMKVKETELVCQIGKKGKCLIGCKEWKKFLKLTQMFAIFLFV